MLLGQPFSKRWKDLRTSVPCLIFDGDKNGSDTFRNFVNQAMLHWKAIKIRKFNVDFIYRSYFTSDLDTWLRVALEKGVEEVSINLMEPQAEKFSRWGEYCTPQRLYSCSSIRKLSLVYCDLKIKGNVHWDQLKSLTIDRVCVSEHANNQVVSGSPQLEVLILRLVGSSDNLNIQSNSLKTLKIERNMDGDKGKYSYVLSHTTLRIWAPKVETLEISGVAYDEYLSADEYLVFD